MPPTRVTCSNCGVDHAPELTRGACPVCGATSTGEHTSTALDSDTRLVGFAIAAMIVNLLLLAWLATIYLQAGT